MAIIGSGQIGRRHIQGLGTSVDKLNVHIFDCSNAAMHDCSLFCKSIAGEINNLKVVFHKSIASLGLAVECFDLVILATTATARPKTLKALIQSCKSKAWILEKPLCQSQSELLQLKSLTRDKFFLVNHYRRCVPFYREIREKYLLMHELDVKVLLPKTGIACNASHYVDLVSFFNNSYPITVGTSKLVNFWRDSKRIHYKEIDGELMIKFSDGSNLSIISAETITNFEINIKSKLDSGLFTIDEVKGTCDIEGGSMVAFKKPFQSELTGKIYDEITATGRCKLTSFETAAKCYEPLILGFQEHFQNYARDKYKLHVPIT